MARGRLGYVIVSAFAVGMLVLMSLPGCANTEVQHGHHLLSEDSSAIPVYVLRQGQRSLPPLKIDLDGEFLMKMGAGQYTLLHLKPGKYGMTVTVSMPEWKKEEITVSTANGWETKDTTRLISVDVTRGYELDFAPNDSVYLLLSKEESNILGTIVEDLVGNAAQALTTIPLGDFGTMTILEYTPSHRGDGYLLESVSRDSAITLAAELKPMEDANKSPLQK